MPRGANVMQHRLSEPVQGSRLARSHLESQPAGESEGIFPCMAPLSLQLHVDLNNKTPVLSELETWRGRYP